MLHFLPIHPLPNDCIGHTVVFKDEGIREFTPPQTLTGVIVSVSDHKLAGRHYQIETEGFNLPRLVRAENVIAYCDEIAGNAKAAPTAEAIEAA